MIKINGKVDKQNNYDGVSSDISFFIQGRTFPFNCIIFSDFPKSTILPYIYIYIYNLKCAHYVIELLYNN